MNYIINLDNILVLHDTCTILPVQLSSSSSMPSLVAVNWHSSQKWGNIIQCHILKSKAMCSSINLWFKANNWTIQVPSKYFSDSPNILPNHELIFTTKAFSDLAHIWRQLLTRQSSRSSQNLVVQTGQKLPSVYCPMKPGVSETIWTKPKLYNFSMEFLPKAMWGPVAHAVKCCSDKLDFVHPSLLPSDYEGGLGQNFPLFFLFFVKGPILCVY